MYKKFQNVQFSYHLTIPIDDAAYGIIVLYIIISTVVKLIAEIWQGKKLKQSGDQSGFKTALINICQHWNHLPAHCLGFVSCSFHVLINSHGSHQPHFQTQ